MESPPVVINNATSRAASAEPQMGKERVIKKGNTGIPGETWDTFLETHSDIILRVAQIVAHDHDSAMDCYVYVLDRLRENDAARLRAYTPEANCSFRTWLAVVVRRLCVDRYREKYGRSRGIDTRSQDSNRLRRRIADLIGVETDLDQLQTEGDSADALERRELFAALDSALLTLPARDRLLLVLRFEDEMSARQIAQVMSFPSLFHVYRQLKSVLAVCREQLRRKGIRAANG